jgi:hypothetical protein
MKSPRNSPQVTPSPTTPRFDAKFIEDHRLIERYLENKLPVKGARDLENWCRANPGYLDALNLADRAQASLKLLEASGKPLDLRDPRPPWWHAPYVPLGLGAVALMCLVGLWALFAKYSLVRGELEDARVRLHQGSLVQPATERTVRMTPDRAPGVDRAKIAVAIGSPQMVDLHIDVSYVKAMAFRVVVDKTDQGRALIVDNLLKDSNGELRLTFNTSGLSNGIFAVRIEALPLRGDAAPTPAGWFLLEVR